MNVMLPGNVSGNETDNSSISCNFHDDEVILWYSSREDIEKNSPSRRDGIDLKTETRLRKSYSIFLEELGVRLKFPQITIATASVFCHRFFLRQSHAKNDRWTIATICMFLAGKVEETPRFIKDVIIISYEIIHKKHLSDVQREEVYEQQKELMLRGEELVLSTLEFDLIVRHPYKPLFEAIKKYMAGESKNQTGESKNQFAQVAWFLVNDWRRIFPSFIQSQVACSMRTSLCLQYTPNQIALGAFFLAAEHLTMDLQSYEEDMCQEFDVTPRQLEDIRGQMLELYEKMHIPASQVVHQPVSREMASTDKCPSSDIEGGSPKVKLSQSDDHSVHDRSRPEGIEKGNSESEAVKSGDDHSVHIITVETIGDVGVSQLEKDLQLHPEEVNAKGNKDKKSFDKVIKKSDLRDENDFEVEDVELHDEDDKTMQKRSQRFLIVRDSDNNTSTEQSGILDANH